ncbi:Protein zer-1-like protein [Nibea albiflora]|uniref:Protein zer-1-like protein n=1 Tax=Nibea albiflora TaxID=240163 RepID=A0ACB7F925_NIBAL|nr:Protein zer-1-like protein [Nibea albiflora]
MAAKAGDNPDSLMTLATVFCLRNLRKTMCYQGFRNKLCLRSDIFLPSEICDKLVNTYMELVHTDSNFEPEESFFQLFSDPRSTRLTRVQLREDFVRDRDLEAIRKQDLIELHLTYCNSLSSRSLKTLTCFRETLVSLCLFGCSHIFYRKGGAPLACNEDTDEEEDESPASRQALETDFNFQGFNRLRLLNLGGLPDEVDAETLLKPLKSLTSLDLSNVQLMGTTFLTQWKDRLASLVLYNVDLSDELVSTVVEIVNLRHLDISRESRRTSKFKMTRKILTAIVQRLVNLVSLDISGHVMLDNCTVPHFEEAMGRPSIEPCKSSIYPFQELKRPLQFLGLHDTTLCNVTHIPAYKVTGSKNEDQVLNAIEAYTEFRPELAHRAINQLFDIARIQHCSQLLRALQLVIAALKCHKYDKSIQVTGSAALFYLTNTEYRSDQSVRLRREVIQVVLNGMEQYQEVTVQRNCCLTLCNFSIPEELEFQYSRVNQLLLKILEPARQDESIQRIAVHLCNALVCQVDNHHKEAVGKMGFVKTMLNLIQKKLQDRMCDQVMEFSWSALWNITDETPDNCQMFLNCRGMSLFLECLQEFPDKQELHRNMLGLLGNVAEVKALRPQLLTPQFITVFSNLLDSKADGIEVSYNACGVLSHIMFDGPEVWSMEEPLRDTVMDKMWDAIQSWDVSSRRNINYRSFEPILRLLPQSISPVSQHWATWALYNLVSVYPTKYCPLLIKEGGISLLEKVLELESSQPETKDMASKVMEQCENFKEDPMETNHGQEDSDFASQFTEERLGQAEKTELDPHLENLITRADGTKNWTEKILRQTEVLLQPNPSARIEEFIYDKLDKKLPSKVTNAEVLGQYMLEAASEFGPGTPYGHTLITVGEYQKRLGGAERELLHTSATTFLTPLRNFLEGDWRTISKEKRLLENRRLDLDICKARLKKAKLAEAKAAAAPDFQETRPRNYVLSASASAVRVPSETNVAEHELRVAQTEFDRQAEVTRLLLEGISSTHLNHLRCLHDFAEAQATYYAQCHHYMQDLQRELNRCANAVGTSLPSAAVCPNPVSSAFMSGPPSPGATVSSSSSQRPTTLAMEQTQLPVTGTRKAKVLYDYDAHDTSELSLLADELITVYTIPGMDPDWLIGERGNEKGKVPVTYLELLS